MSESRKLTDHDEIREWVEGRGGRPTVAKGTGDKGKGAGVLRLDFGEQDEGLEGINWDEWFQTFDDSDLALLVQDETAGGKESRFNKLVSR